MTEHCIVQENDQAPIGDEEKEQNDQAPIGDEEQEQQQRSQIRKKEESKVLKLKVEKSTLWEEDTEKNLDKSENVSQIFTSDSSNSDSPNDDPIPRQKMILELYKKRRKHRENCKIFWSRSLRAVLTRSTMAG